MKIGIQKTMYAAMIVIAVYLLNGCAAHRPSFGSSQNQGSSNKSFGQTSMTDGTSDSGGGELIAGRPVESYIRDPMQLPAYKKYLAPLFARIKSTQTSILTFNLGKFLAESKSWYFAPVDLVKLNKNSLGLTFLKSGTEQIARQTLSQVWIDQSQFAPMSLKDQAAILLHEMVEEMYLFKFMPLATICRNLMNVGAQLNMHDCFTFDKYDHPLSIRPLTAKDNQNIFFVTGWLLQNHESSIPNDKLFQVMVQHGFDYRVFGGITSQMPQKDDLKVSDLEIANSLKGAEIAGTMPNVCHALESQSSQKCQVHLVEGIFKKKGEQTTAPRFQVAIGNERKTVLWLLFKSQNWELDPVRAENGDVEYYWPVDGEGSNIKIGSRVYSGFVVFTKPRYGSQSLLKIKAIIFEPAIVASIDLHARIVCGLVRPRIKDIFDNTIVINNDPNKISYSERIYAQEPPYVDCGPDNVASLVHHKIK